MIANTRERHACMWSVCVIGPWPFLDQRAHLGWELRLRSGERFAIFYCRSSLVNTGQDRQTRVPGAIFLRVLRRLMVLCVRSIIIVRHSDRCTCGLCSRRTPLLIQKRPGRHLSNGEASGAVLIEPFLASSDAGPQARRQSRSLTRRRLLKLSRCAVPRRNLTSSFAGARGLWGWGGGVWGGVGHGHQPSAWPSDCKSRCATLSASIKRS